MQATLSQHDALERNPEDSKRLTRGKSSARLLMEGAGVEVPPRLCNCIEDVLWKTTLADTSLCARIIVLVDGENVEHKLFYLGGARKRLTLAGHAEKLQHLFETHSRDFAP